jgi:hypothetical protein
MYAVIHPGIPLLSISDLYRHGKWIRMKVTTRHSTTRLHYAAVARLRVWPKAAPRRLWLALEA